MRPRKASPLPVLSEIEGSRRQSCGRSRPHATVQNGINGPLDGADFRRAGTPVAPSACDWQLTTTLLRPRLVNNVERRFRRTTEAGETRGGHHFPNSLL